MSEAATTGTGQTITAEVAAKLLMIEPPQFQECVRKGWITAVESGRYPWIGVVQGYIRFVRSKLVPEDEIRRARKREIDLRVAEKERTVIPVTDHRAVIAEGFAGLQAELHGIGGRVTSDAALGEAIRVEIESALHRAADRLDQAAAKLGVPGEPSEDATSTGEAERAAE